MNGREMLKEEPMDSAQVGKTRALAQFATLISDLSARFINLLPDQVDTAIERALGELRESFEIDRCGLLEVSSNTRDVHISHSSYGPGVPEVPRKSNLEQLFPWCYRRLVEEGRCCVYSNLMDMPLEADGDRQIFQASGVQSILMIPLFVTGEVRFILAANSFRYDRQWSEEYISQLRLLGEIFINALERKKSEIELQEGKERLNSAIDVADLAFYDINSWEGPVFFDNRFQQLIGIPPQEVHHIGDFWFEHVHPDDRELVFEARQKIHSGQVNRISLEYRYCHPERGVRWLSHVSKVIGGDIEKGNPRVIGVVQDITERKEMETKLKSQLHEIEMLKQQLEQENLYLREETKLTASFENLDGSSAALKRVMTQAQQVAATNSTVLILGETGTGKELIAQAIHNLSPRKKRVLVKVNCASLPAALIESELFGREKGAYTGAMTSQIGRFELANGSTLFLDEIGEMSLEVQAKLLRILQEGEFERLGSPKTVRVDVRVIAATNRDLLEEVQKGRFREDLYYRLKVFPIEMPPLRERTEDIPALVGAFIREFSEKMGKNVYRLPKGAIEAMQRYHWPGNIRELRNLIEQAFIISEGEILRINVPQGPVNGHSAIQTLEKMEYQHILRALEKCQGHIKGPQGAAQLLGLNPSTLYSKMKKMGIPISRPKDERPT
jgi:formate hydrogenlyase transcriptional activator